MFDTATGRIIDSHELPPKKVGHPKRSGAIRKGFDAATQQLSTKLTQALTSKK